MTIASLLSAVSGDFRPFNGDPQCRRVGSTYNFYWLVSEDSNNEYVCKIRPGETYYLNIAYAEGEGNDLSNICTESECGHLLAWDNNQ